MMWASLSPADRVTHLDTLVRQALQSGELSEQVADAVYALGQRQDLSVDEQHLLRILNDAILQGDVEPAQAVAPLFSPAEVTSEPVLPDPKPSSLPQPSPCSRRSSGF
jgi:hypothetical protein